MSAAPEDPRIPSPPPEVPPLLSLLGQEVDVPLVAFRTPDRVLINRLVTTSIMLVATTLVLIIGMAFLYVQGQDNQKAVLLNRINGFQNRAVICQIVADQHETVPPQCDDPNVTLYWHDPAA